ncbi:MAG: Molybdopterin oxidoreductase Fe4S4 domain, partial [Firmicutes bacterium]|nr:Molybdopterin oxidoreductase Fe4S4 domain [Bacillota bacterium]
MTSTEVRNTLCRMCDEHCAIQVTLQDGKMTVIEGCESHSWNRGRICGKAPSAIT